MDGRWAGESCWGGGGGWGQLKCNAKDRDIILKRLLNNSPLKVCLHREPQNLCLFLSLLFAAHSSSLLSNNTNKWRDIFQSLEMSNEYMVSNMVT